jgi:hypothetical protein
MERGGKMRPSSRRPHHRHCERSEAIQTAPHPNAGLLRPDASRTDAGAPPIHHRARAPASCAPNVQAEIDHVPFDEMPHWLLGGRGHGRVEELLTH